MSEDFEYVVQPKRKQRVAFGSTRDRETSLLRSKFDRTSALHTPELFPNLSPVSYNLERVCSSQFLDIGEKWSAGSSLENSRLRPAIGIQLICGTNLAYVVPKTAFCILCRRPQQQGGSWTKVPRFKRITSDGPPPNAYTFQRFPIPSKRSEVPFNIKTPRDSSFFLGNFSPGPGTYNPKIEFLHTLRYYQKFGRNKIEVKAPDDVNDLHRKCESCHKSPTESGEPFWKKAIQDRDSESVMCCDCMKNLQKDALADLKKKSVMNAYKLVCECPYYKLHAGIHNGQVRASWKEDKKLPKEARFDKFLLKTTQKEKDK
ncbi:hypothetical protein J437_LFUL015514 [Ladona fulva]|uniref:Uncharacterized protein n=1 Tax=Ladona fulva TaxID=123851 RepID=A0A8K0KGU0_LADFU|nr:hypothetical protein J437_LFUL015514 [Ladona fulva]